MNNNIDVKDIKIFNNMCTASILAHNLIDKLNILAKYEIFSIINNKGVMNKGTPLGINRLKISNLWIKLPIILLNMKKLKDKVKGRINCDVVEQLKGIIPMIFKRPKQSPVSNIKYIYKPARMPIVFSIKSFI